MFRPLVAAALLACAAPARAGVSLEGHFPEVGFAGRQAIVDDVWAFVRALAGAPADTPPPLVHFSRFSVADQEPEWTAWQKGWVAGHPEIYADWLCQEDFDSRYAEGHALCGQRPRLLAWIAAHPELSGEYPFPSTFRAFHYDGTNRIQIDPMTTYFAFYQNGPDGMPRDYVGLGYYVTGHEMMHYALERAGVPGATHHCLFITPRGGAPSYMEQLADFLAARGYSSYAVKRYGLGPEIALDPCRAAAGGPSGR